MSGSEIMRYGRYQVLRGSAGTYSFFYEVVDVVTGFSVQAMESQAMAIEMAATLSLELERLRVDWAWVDEDGDLTCGCGNNPYTSGFDTCNSDGERMPPLALESMDALDIHEYGGSWKGHYVCNACRLIIATEVHETRQRVVGWYRNPPVDGSIVIREEVRREG